MTLHGEGWVKSPDGILEPLWSHAPVLPPSLVDLLEQTTQEMEENDEWGELQDVKFDELFDDDD